MSNLRTEIKNLLSVLVLPPRSFLDALSVAAKLAALRMSFSISQPCAQEIEEFADALSGVGALDNCRDWLQSLSVPLVFVLGGQSTAWGELLAASLAKAEKADPQPVPPDTEPLTQRSEYFPTKEGEHLPTEADIAAGSGLLDVRDDEQTDVTANPFAGRPIS